jgi:hypothetical protein
MASTTNGSTGVLVDAQGGITVIPAKADLTRLNYFDGRFVRADDLQAEQDYLRTLVRLSNRAGGAGIVDGLDAALSASHGSIVVKPGLAFDGDGHTLLLPIPQTLDVGKLINAAQKAAAPAAIAGSSDFGAVAWKSAAGTPATPVPGLYLLTVGFAEAACGQESVYGNLCADPCSGSTNARYLVEGVIFRAAPLALDLSAYAANKHIVLEAKHLRSRVASAYFAREATVVQSLISGAGLRAGTWCLGAAAMAGGDVPLAVFQWSGSAIQFLDAWTARRERMEPPPRRYWAQRMAMRPWDAYLAQILQFQCQLHELLAGAGEAPIGVDPCGEERQAIKDAIALFAKLDQRISGLSDVRNRLLTLGAKAATAGGELVDGGIIELPPAGYLPVNNTSGEAVEPQVRRMLGQGPDLRFCVVRPDYVPHALEERQHMNRISLLDGLNDPTKRQEVDVLVPNGKLVQTEAPAVEDEFTVKLTTYRDDGDPGLLSYLHSSFPQMLPSWVLEYLSRYSWMFEGAGRRKPDGEVVLGAGMPSDQAPNDDYNSTHPRALFVLLRVDEDPFSVTVPSTLTFSAEIVVALELYQFQSFCVDVVGTLWLVPNATSVQAKLKLTMTRLNVTPPENGIFELESEVTFVRTGATARVEVHLPTINMDAKPLAITWQPKGTGIELAVEYGKTLTLQSTTVEKDGALEPKPPRVTQALDLIQKTRPDGATWRAHADAELFPPPVTAAGSTDIYPTLDWVLFCRRRPCHCDVAAPPVEPAPQKARQFQVWSINVMGLVPLNDARKALMLKYPERYEARKIDVIEFPATGHALDDTSKALAKWKDAHKDWFADAAYVVEWAGIAMNKPVDDASLETSRLIAYENAIEPATPAVPGANRREVLAEVPKDLPALDTDGVVILAIPPADPVPK